MIDVIHVPEKEALQTALLVVKTLGPDHELSQQWIKAVSHFGIYYRPDPNRPNFPFSKPV